MIKEIPTLSQSYSSDDNDSDESVDGRNLHRDKLSLCVNRCIEEEDEEKDDEEKMGSVSIDFAIRGHRLHYVLSNSVCVKEVLNVVKEEMGALQAVHYRYGRSESLLHALERNKSLVESLPVPLVANEQQSGRKIENSQLLSSKRSLSSEGDDIYCSSKVEGDRFGVLEEILKHLLWEYPHGKCQS